MRILAPYPEYVDVHVDFLDRIPSGWTIRPAVTLAKVLTSTVDKHTIEGEVPIRLCNYTDVYYNDIIRDEQSYMRATATLDQISSYSVEAGDVVLTKDSETADDIGIGAYVESTLPGVVYGYHLSTYRPHDHRYGKFLKWLLDSKYVKATFQTRTLGVTRVGLSQNTVRYLRVPTPPPAEAELIGAFLDRETAEIDAFIADQEELIGLVAERRAATISHAVTRGIDSNIAQSETNSPWFPTLPAGWKLMAIRFGASLIQTGPFGSQLHSHEYVTEGVPLINPMHIVDGEIRYSSDMTVTPDKARELQRHMLRLGDVIVGRRGELGRSAVVTVDSVGALCGTGSAIIRLISDHLDSRYFQLVFSSTQTRDALLQYSVGSTMDNLNSSVVGSLRIPKPPIDEQRAIVEYVGRETDELDATISDAEDAITLSRERRAALISAAVTGKIDVREVGVVA